MSEQAKTIYEKLAKVQSELKVEKDQWNEFGKFKYRNAETILKNVKPLLNEVKALVVLTDQIVEVGEHNYLKAKAIFIDLEKGDDQIEVEAYAKEPLEKKGMDASQITGASSSYARKYALCGLFGIDDGIDNDTFDNSKSGKKAPAKKDTTSRGDGFKVDFKEVREQIKKAQSVEELTVIWTMLADPDTKKVPAYVDKYLKEDFSKRKAELTKGNENDGKVITANN